MYLTYTRHKVKEYDRWKEAFDENSPMLSANNVSWEIAQINGDSTDIAVICRCESKKEWDAFAEAVQTKMNETGTDGREKGGVIGDPEWWAGEIMEQ
jgi:ribosomal silencing factor RsfS